MYRAPSRQVGRPGTTAFPTTMPARASLEPSSPRISWKTTRILTQSAQTPRHLRVVVTREGSEWVEHGGAAALLPGEFARRACAGCGDADEGIWTVALGQEARDASMTGNDVAKGGRPSRTQG